MILTPKTENKTKLHIGCGRNYFNGWINIDNNSDNNITKLDLNLDLRNPLPFKDDSVDFIYNEHFLEHLTAAEGLKALIEFRRVLKPGGMLRISMPDLEESVNNYNNKDWIPGDCGPLGVLKTRAEYLNICFRWWGHQWLYDWDELDRRLQEAGFSEIKQCKLRESDIPELVGLETRDESILIAEAIKT